MELRFELVEAGRVVVLRVRADCRSIFLFLCYSSMCVLSLISKGLQCGNSYSYQKEPCVPSSRGGVAALARADAWVNPTLLMV